MEIPAIIVAPNSLGTKMARMISFVRAHKRLNVIIFLWVVFCAFVLIPNWREGPFYFLFFSVLFLTMIGSQVFWIPRVVGLRPGNGFLDGRPRDAGHSVGLPQSAQGCGRPRRRARAWHNGS